MAQSDSRSNPFCVQQDAPFKIFCVFLLVAFSAFYEPTVLEARQALPPDYSLLFTDAAGPGLEPGIPRPERDVLPIAPPRNISMLKPYYNF